MIQVIQKIKDNKGKGLKDLEKLNGIKDFQN